jgi:hypothetical protein
MNHVYADGFATGFVAGMACMALGVVCFVSTVRHLLHQTKSTSSQDVSLPRIDREAAGDILPMG